MTVNSNECLFLRCWYRVWGCEHPFTDTAQQAVEEALKAHYSQGFTKGNLRPAVLEAYINSTAREVAVKAAAKAKKQRVTCSVQDFLARLQKLKVSASPTPSITTITTNTN